MSVTTSLQSLAERIEQHSLSRDTFQSFDQQRRYAYHMVDTGMDPEKNLCWGYCEQDNCWYISSSVDMSLRVGVLQMEDYRRTHRVSRLEAVKFALEQRSNLDHLALIKTLRAFYQGEMQQFEQGIPVSKTPDAQDVIVTEDYLANLLL